MKPCSWLFLLIVSTLLHTIATLGQTRKQAYSLTGTINADTGTVVLLPIGGEDFNPDSRNVYRTNIKQGQFHFEGKMPFPSGFVIALFPNYVSSPFMIESGKQTINCNVDSLRETPKVSNKSTQEISSLLNTKRTVLFAYVKQHPASYGALYNLLGRMSNGYEPIFDSIYASFSPSLKSSYVGKVISQRLKSSRATAVGQVFPRLKLLDVDNKSVTFATNQQSTYTLVDFWFSHCGPCLEEFPKLIELVASYQPKGFFIIGISVDNQANRVNWKKVIAEKKLDWQQYLDLAGKQTSGELSINLFPSNLLLDENGRIIRKNISPVELGKFLAEKM